jgi:hypothetical protein
MIPVGYLEILYGALAGMVLCTGGSMAHADYAAEVLALEPLTFWRFNEAEPFTHPDNVATNLGTVGALANGTYSDQHAMKGEVGALSGSQDTCARFSNPTGDIYYVGNYVDVPHVAELNPYVFINRNVNQNDNEGMFRVFRCPNDRGADPGRWAVTPKPTLFDTFGCSYFYNSGGNENGAWGLHGRRLAQVLAPSKVIVANDYPFNMWGFQADAPGPAGKPFQYAYWHHEKALCWGNVLFVDTHIVYCQATYDKPDFQNGNGWTFLYCGPRP